MFGPSIEKLKAAGDVERLVAIVAKGREKRGAPALDALIELSDGAVPRLAAILSRGPDAEKEVDAATYALGRIATNGSAAAQRAITAALRDTEAEWIRREPLLVLLEGLRGEDLANAVIDVLEDPRSCLQAARTQADWVSMDKQPFSTPDYRETILMPAFQVLGDSREPRARGVLTIGREWHDPFCKAMEIELVVKQGRVSTALAMFTTADDRVRERATWALTQLSSS